MDRPQHVYGRAKLFAKSELPVLDVDFEYDVIEVGTSRPGVPAPLIIEGKVTSNDSITDFPTFLQWSQNQTRLTLQGQDFELQIYLSSAEGHFRASGKPVPI